MKRSSVAGTAIVVELERTYNKKASGNKPHGLMTDPIIRQIDK